jgi:glycosyltransferase involved in cell wall biosynthesis
MLVSVIIPCYNVESYISECLESVLNQTYPDIEIICVDNNSSDQTFTLIKNYKEKHNNIIVLSERKPGASYARNKGLKKAKGKWIQFLDADDLLLPDKITHQIKMVQQINPSFLAAACYRQTINGERIIINVSPDDPYKALYITKLGNTCANLFRADSLNMIDGWKESLKSSQESDLMFNLLKNGFKVTYDHIPLTIIRERESGQISQRDPREKWLQYICLRVEMIQFLKLREADYFKNEKSFYYQNLFSQLRILAKFDLDKAVEIFNANFTKDFLPISEKFSVYSYLFRLFGFKKAEQIRSFIR